MMISIRALESAMANARIIDKDLCAMADVSKPSLAQIKSGKRNPKPATIGKLAHALGVHVEDLVSNKEPERRCDRPMKTDRLTMTAREAAKELSVSEAQVYKLMERPDFPTLCIGERRKVIPTDLLREWIKQQTGR